MTKAALITGGAIRVGKAITLALAGRGYDIALHYHSSKEDAERVKKEVEALGVRCALFPCDLSVTSGLKPLMEEVFTTFPACDVLINNAALFEKGSLMESDEALFDRHMALNIKAPYFLTQYFAAQMGKGTKGSVVNIVDTYITRQAPAFFPYHLSKKALYDFTLMAAKELAPSIRVNALALGSMLEPYHKSKEETEREERLLPLGRPSLSHATQALLMLLENDGLTGECIFVDGGKKLV